MFTTIYSYNLHTKKYINKLKSDVSICPSHEYRVLGRNRLLAVSQQRQYFIEWSLENGKVNILRTYCYMWLRYAFHSNQFKCVYLKVVLGENEKVFKNLLFFCKG